MTPGAGGRVPEHVGIIMDGNGRWARRRGMRRTEGHRAAERSIHDAVEVCGEAGVRWLTLFAFSTENWSRPAAEVRVIMSLLGGWIRRNVDELDSKDVRIRAMGHLDDLPSRPRGELEAAIGRTEGNAGLNLVLALSYGGRVELVDAVRSIAADVRDGSLDPGDVDADTVSGRLYLPGMPDADLIIRTSGEMRISNFLLWRAAYAEFFFSPVLWPDFGREHMEEALRDYAGRSRRFGAAPSGERER